MAIDKTDEAKEIDNAENVPGLVAHVKKKFTSAEDGKNEDETRWLQAYKNYRGIFDSTTQFRSSEKSKVFVKITKVKVLSAYGQIADILFANSKFPLSVEATPVPEGVAEFAHLQTPQSSFVSKFRVPCAMIFLTPGPCKSNFAYLSHDFLIRFN